MQIHHIGYGIKGFYRLGGYGLRWGMLNDKTEHKLKILAWISGDTRCFYCISTNLIQLETTIPGNEDKRANRQIDAAEASKATQLA